MTYREYCDHESYSYAPVETVCTGCNNFTRNCECKERAELLETHNSNEV